MFFDQKMWNWSEVSWERPFWHKQSITCHSYSHYSLSLSLTFSQSFSHFLSSSILTFLILSLFLLHCLSSSLSLTFSLSYIFSLPHFLFLTLSTLSLFLSVSHFLFLSLSSRNELLCKCCLECNVTVNICIRYLGPCGALGSRCPALPIVLDHLIENRVHIGLASKTRAKESPPSQILLSASLLYKGMCKDPYSWGTRRVPRE